MRYWEINGNLNDKETGIANYQVFQKAVCATKTYFDEVFGSNRMNQVFFYVDNATDNSGYTPISTPVLGKIVIINCLSICTRVNSCSFPIIFWNG